jgi:nicotinate-nucleotide pyrophosphorylase (carboxylating)
MQDMKIESSQYEQVVQNALTEDRCRDDITTGMLIPPELKGIARIIAKEKGTLAGTDIAGYVFHEIDSGLDVQVLIYDGSLIRHGDVLITVMGATAGILKAERTVLNFLQHLSGIATETAHYVDLIKDLPCQVTDTRKTIPGMRAVEKYAVAVGGGKNHRMNLCDGILIKDNHLDILYSQGHTLKDIVSKARENNPAHLRIEVEARSPEEAIEAADAGADIVMLDNMSMEDTRRAVDNIKGRSLIEASGGITIDNIRAVAETGVDYISVGALTHSARSLDISLELE